MGEEKTEKANLKTNEAPAPLMRSLAGTLAEMRNMSQTIQMIMMLSAPFLTGLILRLRGKHGSVAWMLSSLVPIPVIILFDEFVLPYRGGGASMWPIALIFGGFYGTILGGLGALSASFYLRKKATPNQGLRRRPGLRNAPVRVKARPVVQ